MPLYRNMFMIMINNLFTTTQQSRNIDIILLWVFTL